MTDDTLETCPYCNKTYNQLQEHMCLEKLEDENNKFLKGVDYFLGGFK